jgi:PAS domain S-box-containing protein
MNNILPHFKLSIFQKLLIGIFAMLLLNAIVAFVGIKSINELENMSHVMLEESHEQNSFQKLKLNVQRIPIPVKDYLVHRNRVELDNFEQVLSLVRIEIQDCRKIIGHPEEVKVLDDLESMLIEAEDLAVKIFKREDTPGDNESAIMMIEVHGIANKAILKIDELSIIASMELSEYINSNHATNIKATRTIIIIGLIVAFCLVIGGFFYVREITKPIKHLSQAADRISLGDMTVKADVGTKNGDEIADFANSFNTMIGVLEKTTVSRDYFNNILNRMVDTLIITDAQGIIKIVNQATLDLLEYTEEEIVGQPFQRIISREFENEELKSPDFEKHPEEQITNIYNTYYSCSGKTIPVSFSQSMMYDKENTLTGVLYIAYHNNGKQPVSQEDKSDDSSKNIKAIGEIPLTKRELEIIKMIAEEISNREIAEKLFISVRTVETHRKNIMQKLHTKSVITLVHYASQNGII